MAEAPIQKDYPLPETDLQRIAVAAGVGAEHAVAAEHHDAAVTHEAIRATLQTMAGVEPAPPPMPPAAPVVSTQPTTPSDTLPDYIADAPAAVRAQIDALVATAQQKGIDVAHAEAQKGDPFLLDAFHDVMTGKLYEAFKERGMLR